jgi:hypothetical protein
MSKPSKLFHDVRDASITGVKVSHAISNISNVPTTSIMHNSGGLRSEEANNAAWEGGKGAVAGAAKVSIVLAYFVDRVTD